MILILSIRNDISTAIVAEWLLSKNAEFIIINHDEELLCKHIDDENFIFEIKGRGEFNLKDVTASWYRIGVHQFKYYTVEDLNEPNLSKYLSRWIDIDQQKIIETFHTILKQKKHLSSFLTYDINRMSVLNKSKELGLLVPEWIITSSKSVLQEFYNKHKKIITKSLGWNVNFNFDNTSYSLYTNIVEEETIRELSDCFANSFFQKYIEKNYEVRTFYLNGKFFSMAIFSQENKESIVDFRKDSFKVMSRTVPYNLPSDIESKLKQLMAHFKMNNGSIDIMKGVDGNYYILEINPNGQFNMVSRPCNYKIEKEIAEFLITN